MDVETFGQDGISGVVPSKWHPRDWTPLTLDGRIITPNQNMHSPVFLATVTGGNEEATDGMDYEERGCGQRTATGDTAVLLDLSDGDDDSDEPLNDNVVITKEAITHLVAAMTKRRRSNDSSKSTPGQAKPSKHGWLVDGKGYRIVKEEDKASDFEKRTAVCLLCPEHAIPRGGVYLLNSKKNPSNTSWRSAISHMISKHGVKTPADLEAIVRGERDPCPKNTRAQQVDIRAFGEPYGPRTPEYTKRKRALARWVAWENMPLHIGEREGFLAFMRTLDQRWPKISRRTVARSVQEQAEDCVSQISREMEEVSRDVDVSWTVDCWSSLASDRYLTTTLHYIDRNWTPVTRVLGTRTFNETHSARNISRLMKVIRMKYGLPPKTPKDEVYESEEAHWQAEHKYDRPCITTDLGADICAGVERDALWDWNRCICHCIHLAVTAGTKDCELEQALKEVRTMAVRMKRSSTAWRNFKNTQWEWIKENQPGDAHASESLGDACTVS